MTVIHTLSWQREKVNQFRPESIKYLEEFLQNDHPPIEIPECRIYNILTSSF